MFGLRKRTTLGALIGLIGSGVFFAGKFYENELRCFVGLDDCQSLRRTLIVDNTCPVAARLDLRYRDDDSKWKEQAWRINAHVQTGLTDATGDKVSVARGHYFQQTRLLEGVLTPTDKPYSLLPFAPQVGKLKRAEIYNNFEVLFKPTTKITVICDTQEKMNGRDQRSK